MLQGFFFAMMTGFCLMITDRKAGGHESTTRGGDDTRARPTPNTPRPSPCISEEQTYFNSSRVHRPDFGRHVLKLEVPAARNSKTINKNLIAVEMERTGQAFCSFHSEDGAETMLIPDTISIQGASTQMTISAAVSGAQAKVRIQGKIRKRVEL
jgi:hypothetical protein